MENYMEIAASVLHPVCGSTAKYMVVSLGALLINIYGKELGMEEAQ